MALGMARRKGWQELVYATSGKIVIQRHEGDPGHKAAVRTQHTSCLLGAAAIADVAGLITDPIYDLKICVCSFMWNMTFLLRSLNRL